MKSDKTPDQLARALVAEILSTPDLDTIIDDHIDAWDDLVSAKSKDYGPCSEERAEWERLCDRIKAAIPQELRVDYIKVQDGYTEQAIADRDAAFALGLALGRAQAEAEVAR